jgi:2-polyprenyl-6-methoxyphenol hydroxylase-like FAD-dependent oxidoreductase
MTSLSPVPARHEPYDADVIIVGAGPVGLVAAMDLDGRGIPVILVEQRPFLQPPSVKCNHVAARTMERFRRLGVVAQVRAAGLPHVTLLNTTRYQGLTQDDNGVSVTITALDGGDRRVLRARFLIGADGGRSGWPVASSPTGSATGGSSSPATRRTCGSRTAATA